MAKNKLDLAGIFQSVTQELVNNQDALNQADEYNQDHGDNMVQTFQTISDALQQKQRSSDSAALRYAARQVSQNTTSGSGKIYAENLNKAADEFKGQNIDSRGALQLLETLIGGQVGQAGGSGGTGGDDMLGALLGGLLGGGTSAPQAAPQSGGDDMLGALLGGLLGGESSAPQAAPQSGGDDMLGALLGGLLGGESSAPQAAPQSGGDDMLGALLGGLLGGGTSTPQAAPQSTGSDMLGSLLGGLLGGESSAPQAAPQSGGDDMLGALLGGLLGSGSSQSGGSLLQTLAQAFLNTSGMGDTNDRTQSTTLVINAFLKALGTLAKK